MFLKRNGIWNRLLAGVSAFMRLSQVWLLTGVARRRSLPCVSGWLLAAMLLLGFCASGARAQSLAATDTVGSNPYAVAVNPVTNTVYVANEGGNTNSIAMDATGNVWIANSGNSSVTELTSAGSYVQQVRSGISSPASLAINPK